MKRIVRVAAAAFLASAALWSANAGAQASGAWQFDAILYGYFPAIGGKSNFPFAAGGGVTVDPSDYIGNLKGGFLGTLEARKGDWGAFTDVLYLNLGGSKSATRDLTIGGLPLPATATADAHLTFKTLVWTVAGNFRAVATPDATLDILAGARLLEAKQRLDLTLNGDLGAILFPGRSASSEVNPSLWDGIVGIKGRVAFGDDRKWFLPYYGDVGTGQSRITWQAMGGLGYSFSWGDLFGAWRYLGYEMKSGEPIEKLNLNGPMLGVAFHW